jgi:serine protease
VTPQAIDTSSAAQTVTVTARITDDVSGAAAAGYSNGVPEVRFVSPSGAQIVWASFDPSKRISGTPQDGVYQTTLTVPLYAEQGTWTVQYFRLVDMTGNAQSLTAADLAAAGLPATFNQTGAGDTKPPQLQSFSVTPQAIDTSSAAQTVTVTARITDDRSGVAAPGYSNGVPEVRFVSPSGAQIVWASFDPSKRISGTPQDGVYQTTLTVPLYAEQGTWTVQYFRLVDMTGNAQSLTAADLTAAGLPATFTNGN